MTEQRGSNGAGRIGGVTGKGFQPGKSGNPNGRQRGFAAAVQKLVGKDGAKLVKAAYLLALGSPKDVQAFFGEPVSRPAKVRLDAIAWLGDRGFGKAVETVELTGKDGGPMAVTFGGRYKPDGGKAS